MCLSVCVSLCICVLCSKVEWVVGVGAHRKIFTANTRHPQWTGTMLIVYVFLPNKKECASQQHWMLSLKTCKLELVCGWKYSFYFLLMLLLLLKRYFECHVSKWMDKIKRKTLQEKSVPSILEFIYDILWMCVQSIHIHTHSLCVNIMAFVVHTVELCCTNQLIYLHLLPFTQNTYNGQIVWWWRVHFFYLHRTLLCVIMRPAHFIVTCAILPPNLLPFVLLAHTQNEP